MDPVWLMQRLTFQPTKLPKKGADLGSCVYVWVEILNPELSILGEWLEMKWKQVDLQATYIYIYVYNIYIYIQYTHNIWYIIYYNQCFAYVCLNILLADWPKFPGLNLREKAIDASQNFGDKSRSNDAAELRYISTACLLFVMSPDTNCLVSSSFFYFRFFQVGVKQLACLLFHLTRFFQRLKIRVHPGWSLELLDHQGMW